MQIMRSIKYFQASYNFKKLALLFIVALLLRAGTFYFYTQHQERYQQADSMDYHIGAISLYIGAGMCRLDNRHPTFWRTPGYSAYLLPFYKWYGVHAGQFNQNTGPQKAALWVQIFLSSFIPILLFFLTMVLIGSIAMSWQVAWLFAFHPGFILSSGFLLTEALSMLFFYVFLIFLYRGYRMWGEGTNTQTYTDLIIAALSLGVYTWMRPMGQFVGVIALLLLLLSSLDWKKKLKQCSLFALLFLGSLSPWIIRNYNYTGHAFFWPGSGSYLVCFNVPKIVRRLTGRPLKECLQIMMQKVNRAISQEQKRLQKEEPGHYVSQELVSGKIAWPWMYRYPWWAAQDWAKEAIKTTFDLHSYQLVTLTANKFKWDPIEEFLTEKIALCLYAQPMNWFMRLICWSELLLSILLWVGLFAGFFVFLVQSAWRKLYVSEYKRKMFFLWIKTGLFIGAVLCMTGGFGYARLRMPVEPLMVLLSLTWWYYFLFATKSD